MFKRSHFIALFATAFAFAAPAFADGTGKGPTYNAPAPLTPQSYTIYTNPAPVPHSTYHSTTCQSSCGHSTGPSYSGLPTNPRQNCCGHSYTPTPAPVYHAPAPVVHQAAPVMSMRAGDVVGLDPTTVASFSGGVGTGVSDVFVGGGGFGNGFDGGGSFGLRSSGFFAGRNAALQSSIGGFRGARNARRGGFKGGNRGGFRGGRGGGGRGGRGGGRRGGGGGR